MTDRELLELAAKAAGIGWHAWHPSKVDSASLCLDPYGRQWNPLTDDGDAMRLVVALGLGVQCLHRTKETQAFTYFVYVLEYWKDDPLAATRRAIVRAAAEIGKSMEDNLALRTLARLSDEIGEEL